MRGGGWRSPRQVLACVTVASAFLALLHALGGDRGWVEDVGFAGGSAALIVDLAAWLVRRRRSRA